MSPLKISEGVGRQAYCALAFRGNNNDINKCKTSTETGVIEALNTAQALAEAYCEELSKFISCAATNVDVKSIVNDSLSTSAAPASAPAVAQPAAPTAIPGVAAPSAILAQLPATPLPAGDAGSAAPAEPAESGKTRVHLAGELGYQYISSLALQQANITSGSGAISNSAVDMTGYLGFRLVPSLSVDIGGAPISARIGIPLSVQFMWGTEDVDNGFGGTTQKEASLATFGLGIEGAGLWRAAQSFSIGLVAAVEDLEVFNEDLSVGQATAFNQSEKYDSQLDWLDGDFMRYSIGVEMLAWQTLAISLRYYTQKYTDEYQDDSKMRQTTVTNTSEDPDTEQGFMFTLGFRFNAL